MKQFAAFAALRICDPKGPRSRELRNKRSFVFDSGLSNKRNLFAVRRPNWTSITIRRWREIRSFLRRQIEHGDKGVVLAIRAKRDPFSVRRPARRIAFARQLVELLCLFF